MLDIGFSAINIDELACDIKIAIRLLDDIYDLDSIISCSKLRIEEILLSKKGVI